MKKLFISVIKFYQEKVSPKFFPGCCRFYPTCSHYSLESIERFGAIKGSWMSFKRIVRCNPFSSGGYDPVPPAEHKEGER